MDQMRVIVSGTAGRMGKAILEVMSSSEQVVLAGALESPNHPAIGKDVNEISAAKGVKISSDLEKIIQEGDVIIEFSSPEATMKHLEIASRHHKAMVVGTTGFTAEQEGKVKELTKNFPCVKAPNMSLGMNLMFNLVSKMAQVLGRDCDVEIVETHHHFKKDAPSGTAKKLATNIAAARGQDLNKVAVYGRKGEVGERAKGEIGVHAVRAGSVVGEHTVLFALEGERIELTNRMESRTGYARGALKAALWLSGQPNGLYSMQNVLGLK